MSYRYESNATNCVNCNKRGKYSELKNTSHYNCGPPCLSGHQAFASRSVMDQMLYKKFVHNGEAAGSGTIESYHNLGDNPPDPPTPCTDATCGTTYTHTWQCIDDKTKKKQDDSKCTDPRPTPDPVITQCPACPTYSWTTTPWVQK